jgi:signal transduction histidine kinase/CheY-like chemotaxis protein
MEEKNLNIFVLTNEKEIIPFSSEINDLVLNNKTKILNVLEQEETSIVLEDKVYRLSLKQNDNLENLTNFFQTEISLLVLEEISEQEKKELKIIKDLEEELNINNLYLSLAENILKINSFKLLSQKVLETAQKLTSSPFGFVGYIKDNGDFHIPTLSKNMFPNFKMPEEGVSFKNPQGLFGQSLKQKSVILTNNLKNHPLSKGVPQGHLELERVLLVPAILNGKIIGQIALANKKEDYNEKDLEKIKRLLPFFELSLQAEKQKEILEKEQIKSQKANIYKTMFLAQMSHELRNPLSIIIGLLNVIEKENENIPQNLREHLSEIKKAGKHQLELVNNLLDLTKIEEGKYESVFSKFDVKKEVEELFNLFKLKAQEKNLDYKLELDKNLTDFVYDLKNLKQIIINLLSNAIKYTDKGSVLLTVKKQNNQLVIKIKDTGKGINEEDKKNIWTAFKRGESSANEKMSTGLGLTIVKKLVENLKGEISFDSKENKGTEFVVKINQKTEIIPKNIEEVNSLEKKFLEIPIKGLKILLAEDDNINRLIASKLLKEKGLNITETINGEEALEVFNKVSDFNLVITDIEMPKKNGKELIKELRKKSKIPIITLSGHAFKELEEEFKELGANGSLPKPLDLNKMQEIIRKVYWKDSFEKNPNLIYYLENFKNISANDLENFKNMSNYLKNNFLNDLKNLSQKLDLFLINKYSLNDFLYLIKILKEVSEEENILNLNDLLTKLEKNLKNITKINLFLYLLKEQIKDFEKNL